MSVDLSLVNFGVLTMRSGERGWTYWVNNEDGTYAVRYESGWYCDYAKDGKRLTADTGDSRDIVALEAVDLPEGVPIGFAP